MGSKGKSIEAFDLLCSWLTSVSAISMLEVACEYDINRLLISSVSCRGDPTERPALIYGSVLCDNPVVRDERHAASTVFVINVSGGLINTASAVVNNKISNIR